MAKKRKTKSTQTTSEPILSIVATDERGGRGEEIIVDDYPGKIKISRVRGGLRALYESEEISQEMMTAAQKWRNDYEFGVHGATDPDRRGGGPDSCYQTSRLSALTRYRNASQSVGAKGHCLLMLFVHECFSFSSAARIIQAARAGKPWAWRAQTEVEPKTFVDDFPGLSTDRERLRDDFIQALKALTRHYEQQARLMKAMKNMKRTQIAA